jgi:maleate cis-trans isomerase
MNRQDLLPWFRLGYVTPHLTVDTLAYELYRIAPPGFMLVTTGLAISDYTPDAVDDQIPAFHQAVSLLRSRRVDRIVLSGVPIAVALGRARMRALLDAARDQAGVPVDTDLEAIIAGVQHLEIERVAIATRWTDEVNQGLTRYLAEAGIEVVDTVSSARSISENARLDASTGMQLAIDLGRRAFESPAIPDGVIMPGARWIAIHALQELEPAYDRPLFLNHACGLWAALRQHAYPKPIAGWGRLLASLGA